MQQNQHKKEKLMLCKNLCYILFTLEILGLQQNVFGFVQYHFK